MLDLLVLPALLAVALALRAVRRGGHRTHGHLMATALAMVGLRLILEPNRLPRLPVTLGLGLVATTLLLGRQALAWREGRSTSAHLPRIHRGFGTFTLALATLATLAWLLRAKG